MRIVASHAHFVPWIPSFLIFYLSCPFNFICSKSSFRFFLMLYVAGKVTQEGLWNKITLLDITNDSLPVCWHSGWLFSIILTLSLQKNTYLWCYFLWRLASVTYPETFLLIILSLEWESMPGLSLQKNTPSYWHPFSGCKTLCQWCHDIQRAVYELKVLTSILSVDAKHFAYGVMTSRGQCMC